MKKLSLILLMAIISLPIFARDFLYTYEGQTLKYKILDEEANTCTVTSDDRIYGDLTIPAVVKYGDIKYSVTEIEPNAFFYYDAMTSVIIPNSVTKIGDEAFFYCNSLTSVSIGNSVTEIGKSAFAFCGGLTTLTIPNSVIMIGGEAFSNCIGLKELFFNAENCSSCGGSGHEVFPPSLQTVVFGDNVNIIPDDAFHGCGLTSVSIPNSVTEVGIRAFYGISELTSVTIGTSVTKIGDWAFSGCDGLAELFFNAENCTYCGGTMGGQVFPSSLQKITFGDNVKNIPDWAFCRCNSLTSVIIPNSVTTIGEGVFYQCSSLTSVTIPNSVTIIPYCAFLECKSLISVNIPNSITAIKTSAFGRCISLTSVTIPESVTEIGDWAFEGCDGLAELFFNAGNCTYCGSWDEPAFPSTLQKVTFGDNVKNIPDYTFSRCRQLTEVNISSIDSWLNINFEKYNSNPTYYAKNLLVNGEIIRRLTIPEGTKRINAHSFVNCEQILTVTLPASLESIGMQAFSGCTSLRRDIFPDIETYLALSYDNANSKLTYGNDSKIYIGSDEYDPEEMDWPSSLTKIPDFAFYDNKTLKIIHIPETVTEIGEYAFGDCYGLISANIPNSITEIKKGTFYDCYRLTSVSIPDHVTTIGDGAFSGCESLKSLTIPNSVITIGSGVFSGCLSMTSVTIPNSVTSIGSGAFSCCKEAIKNVYFQSAKLWSRINFGSEESNPIFVAHKFTVNGVDAEHLDLDMDNSDVSNYAFFAAYNLKTIRIKGTGIGGYSFYGCKNITDICLDVNSLGKASFSACNNLKAIYCMTTEPPAAPDEAFSKYDDVLLYVPVGARSKYENAHDCWWRFLDIIETDFEGLDSIFKADYVDNEQPDSVEGVFDDKANSDIDLSAPLEVYTLNGIRISKTIDNLAPGLYIARQGNRSKKIVIK